MAITKLGHMKQAKNGNPAKHLKNSIDYIMNPEKTKELTYIGSNCGYTAEEMYRTFIDTKEEYGKLTGRQGYHFIISFAPKEANPEQVYHLAQLWCEEYLKDQYDYCFSVHDDQDHCHAHIIFNSVNRSDGYKYRYQKGDWEKYIQPVTDRLCIQLNLPVLQYELWGVRKKEPYVAREARRKGTPYGKTVLQADIDAAIQKAIDYPDFLLQMKAMGYEIREGYSKKHQEPYLNFRPVEEKNGRRSYLLDAGYHLPDIQHRISNKIPVPVHVKKPEHYPKRIHHIRIFFSGVTGKSGSIYYMTFFQVLSVKRMYRAKQIHSPYAVRGPQHRKDIRRIQQLSENCSVLIRNQIRTKKQLQQRMTELKIKLKGKLTEEERKQFQKEFKILYRITKQTGTVQTSKEKNIHPAERRIHKVI